MKKGKAGMFWGGRFKDFAKRAGFADTFFPYRINKTDPMLHSGRASWRGSSRSTVFCAAIRLWSSEMAA